MKVELDKPPAFTHVITVSMTENDFLCIQQEADALLDLVGVIDDDSAVFELLTKILDM